MKMIIGGAYQGQTQWAQEQYNIEWIDGADCLFQEIYTCQGILNFHLYIKRILQAGEATEFAKELIERNPDLILVSNEVGYGLVPIDGFERNFREAVGRICTELASASDEVVRVVMGIGTRIK